eukprot:gene12606-6426_t
MDTPPESQLQPHTQQIFYNYILSKLKTLIEETITKREDFSWDDLSEGKYGIDLRGFGNSKYEVEKLLSEANLDEWNINLLVHLIRNLKINNNYVFDQKTRNNSYLLFFVNHCQVGQIQNQHFDENMLRRLILELRYVIEGLDVDDDYDEKQLLDDVLNDYEECFDQQIPALRNMFDKILKNETKFTHRGFYRNQPAQDVFPITFSNSGPNIQSFEFRKSEIETLNNYIEKDKIVVVSGDKGVGKKFLVQKFLRTNKEKAVWLTFERLHNLLSGKYKKMVETHYFIIHSSVHSDTIMNIVQYFKLFDTVKGWFIITNLKKNEIFYEPNTFEILTVKNFSDDESKQYIAKRGGIEKYAKDEDVQKYINFLSIQLSNNPWRVQLMTQFIKSKKLKSTNVSAEIKGILSLLTKKNLRRLTFEEQAQFILSLIIQDLNQKNGNPHFQFFIALVIFLDNLQWTQETVESAIKALDIYNKKETKEINSVIHQLKSVGILQEPLIGDKNSIFSIDSTTLNSLKINFSKIHIPISNDQKILFTDVVYRIHEIMKTEKMKYTESFGLSSLFYLFDYKTTNIWFMKSMYSHGCLNPTILRFNPDDDHLYHMVFDEEFCKISMEEYINTDLLDRKITKDLLKTNEQSVFIHSGIQKEDPDAPSIRRDYIEKQLNQQGYYIKKNVMGDGNCQFRATADQLELNDDKFHVMFRRKVVDWLRENKNLKIGESDELHHFNYEFEEWDEFCDFMNENGVWGDHITLIALANHFNLRIKVISEVADPVIVLPENKKFERKVFLYHHVSGRHYMSILPINAEDEVKRDEEIRRKEQERKIKEEEEKKKMKEKQEEENELKKRKLESQEEDEITNDEKEDDSFEEAEEVPMDENLPPIIDLKMTLEKDEVIYENE